LQREKATAKELQEALEQQTATSEILRVISNSPTDVQPVFETIVRNAVTLCDGLFANAFRFDGALLHFVASNSSKPEALELLRSAYPMPPNASQVSGRAVLTGSAVRMEDATSDPDYDRRHAIAGNWRLNSFHRRIERLEQRMGVKPGPRLIYLTPNLEPDEPEESPYLVKLSSDVWAHVFGAPLSDEEIRNLREEYNEERYRK
jgi:hypothetical protein